MPKFKESYYFEAPVEIVWDLSTDLSTWSELTDVKVDALTVEEFGVGTRWRETRKMMGRDSAQEWEITKIDAPTTYRAVSQAMGAKWVYDQFLVADGDGTRMFVEFDLAPTSSASRISYAATWPVMSMMMRRGMATDFAKFGELARKRAKS